LKNSSGRSLKRVVKNRRISAGPRNVASWVTRTDSSVVLENRVHADRGRAEMVPDHRFGRFHAARDKAFALTHACPGVHVFCLGVHDAVIDSSYRAS
jgi:hypothetical protein